MPYGTAPKSGSGSSTKKKTSTTTKKTTSSSSSGGGGGGGIKKSNDKPQASALESLLKSGLQSVLNKQIADLQQVYKDSDAAVLKDYRTKMAANQSSQVANEESEAAASNENLVNRAREATDILANVAAQGAGETDTLRAKHMALSNWAANQGDVNRAYFDTRNSNNSARTELNTDTYGSRYNLANQLGIDQATQYANYYDKMASTATQLGNLRSNPYSNAYSKSKASKAYKDVAKYAASTWDNPGVSATIKDWQPEVAEDKSATNNALLAGQTQEPKQKRPEGTTLQAW